ncbi:MAG: hypothetical protein CME20_08760 [Gemmatimonadetes bacterium]|nr:hypothetical protein [Gemmatimonadota bacterium]
MPQDHIALVAKEFEGCDIGERVLEARGLRQHEFCGAACWMGWVQDRIAGEVCRVRLCLVEQAVAAGEEGDTAPALRHLVDVGARDQMHGLWVDMRAGAGGVC